MKERNAEQTKKTLAFYLSLALTIVIIATITVATVLTMKSKNDLAIDVGNQTDKEQDGDKDDEPVDSSSKYEFILPVENVNVITGYVFYKNQTLDCFHLHEGVDFACEVGENVVAVLDGVVESITTGSVLDGTVIVLSHENDVKTAYTYVNAVDGLKVGDTVNRGDVIATVAEPDGSEYKDGAHLHFEVFKNGTKVDPETYLEITEK